MTLDAWWRSGQRASVRYSSHLDRPYKLRTLSTQSVWKQHDHIIHAIKTLDQAFHRHFLHGTDDRVSFVNARLIKAHIYIRLWWWNWDTSLPVLWKIKSSAEECLCWKAGVGYGQRPRFNLLFLYSLDQRAEDVYRLVSAVWRLGDVLKWTR